ncbi:MAG: chromate resistance protein, partial [archaeon GB-1845-036]|nr:chromate resistance protein [Candidatus Culexmicrobium thermophilum]
MDSDAEFIFVSPEKIDEVVKETDATPFNAKSVKLGHRNGKCSFEVIIEEYGLSDPTLLELAKIVHTADTGETEVAPE